MPLWLFSLPLRGGRGFLRVVSSFLFFFSSFHRFFSFSGGLAVVLSQLAGQKGREVACYSFPSGQLASSLTASDPSG